MKRTVEITLSEFQNRLMGHVSNMSYLLCNLCVQADPTSLLGAEFLFDGDYKRIEDIAHVMTNEQEELKDQMDVLPKNPVYITPLIEGIMEVHPEFKITLETFEGVSEEAKDDAENKFLRLQMPEVDKNRRDVLLTAIDALKDECQARMDAEKVKVKALLAPKLLGSPKEAVEEANGKTDEICAFLKGMEEQLVEEKKKEVEDAFERYQQKHPQGTAHGEGEGIPDAGKSISLSDLAPQ